MHPPQLCIVTVIIAVSISDVLGIIGVDTDMYDLSLRGSYLDFLLIIIFTNHWNVESGKVSHMLVSDIDALSR